MTSIGMSYVMLGTPNEGSNCAYTATALEAFFGRTIITATNQPLYQLEPSYLAQFNAQITAGAGTVTATVLAEPNVTTSLVDPSGRTEQTIAAGSPTATGLFRTLTTKVPTCRHVAYPCSAGGRRPERRGARWRLGSVSCGGLSSLLRFAATKSRPEQIGRRISRHLDVMTGVGDERAENARIQT